MNKTTKVKMLPSGVVLIVIYLDICVYIKYLFSGTTHTNNFVSHSYIYSYLYLILKSMTALAVQKC